MYESNLTKIIPAFFNGLKNPHFRLPRYACTANRIHIHNAILVLKKNTKEIQFARYLIH